MKLIMTNDDQKYVKDVVYLTGEPMRWKAIVLVFTLVVLLPGYVLYKHYHNKPTTTCVSGQRK